VARGAELRTLSHAGRHLQPVFIVGEARSGTTLLYRLLQQQPAFGPAQPHLVESRFAEVFLTKPDLDEATAWPLRDFLTFDDVAWRRFLAAVAPLMPLRAELLRRRPGVWHNERAASAAGIGWIARAYLAVAAEARQVTRLVEKTPQHTPFAGHLMRWFPGARLLYIARHPVDVITSYWRRAEADEDSAAWARLELETFASLYAKRTAAAQRWARLRPSAFRILRYEDLVHDPERTLEAVCRFAGADFDRTAIEASDRRGPRWDPHLWGPAVEQTKDWRDFIAADVAHALEERLSQPLAALAYRRYT
jgi:hypothetical protein